jgi:benzoylformate decarboxylase
MTGVSAFLDVLAASGVTRIFGNPGTTELPLNDALAQDSRFKYIFGVHEIPVMAMADGYAMASRKPAVVNVHTACGLGNSMGMLYNAHCEGTPLLLTAGQQDRRLAMSNPVLAGDLVGVARPWTKWACEIQRVEDVPVAVRRALQIALTPPTGPVFLSLPLDVQTESVADLDVTGLNSPIPVGRPPANAIEKAARILLESRTPAILAGSRVTEAGACELLAALAEEVGAPVFSEAATSHGRVPISSTSPMYAGPLPLWSPDVRKALDPFDLLFVVGMNLLRLYIWREPEIPLPPNAKIIHADVDVVEIGRNFPVEIALPGDLRPSLSDLLAEIRSHSDRSSQSKRDERIHEFARQRERERQSIRQRAELERGRRPMTSLVLMDAIARAWPSNAILVDEAVTTSRFALERMGVLQDPYAYFGHRGRALGWGMGCAIGVKLALPERPVLGLIGDGAALYGVQGLWSAAHHRVPVTFVIANNAQYKILKECGDMLPLPRIRSGDYLGMDLTSPEIDFIALTRSLGVKAIRVEDPQELTQSLRESWSRSEPILFDVPIER